MNVIRISLVASGVSGSNGGSCSIVGVGLGRLVRRIRRHHPVEHRHGNGARGAQAAETRLGILPGIPVGQPGGGPLHRIVRPCPARVVPAQLSVRIEGLDLQLPVRQGQKRRRDRHGHEHWARAREIFSLDAFSLIYSLDLYSGLFLPLGWFAAQSGFLLSSIDDAQNAVFGRAAQLQNDAVATGASDGIVDGLLGNAVEVERGLRVEDGHVALSCSSEPSRRCSFSLIRVISFSSRWPSAKAASTSRRAAAFRDDDFRLQGLSGPARP